MYSSVFGCDILNKFLITGIISNYVAPTRLTAIGTIAGPFWKIKLNTSILIKCIVLNHGRCAH